MDKKEILKSMLNNLINDNESQASVDMHDYLSSKMREVMNVENKNQELPASDEHAEGA